jgi:hypothetical protein
MPDEQIGSERSGFKNQSDDADTGSTPTRGGLEDRMTGPQDRAMSEREAVCLTRADKNRISIRIQPDVAFGKFQRALQRALDLAALGLQATQTGEDLPELGTFPVQHFGSRLSLESLRAEYLSWIMGHALTDIVEALEPLMADAIKICRLSSLISERRDINEKRVNKALSLDFEKEPLGAKLDRLAREAPGVLPADLQLALKALNKLRVCLTHAGGKVRAIDCRPNDELELSCIFWEFFVEYEDGTREAVLPGLTTKGEGWVVMCRTRVPRTFRAGDEIQLTKQDLFRIAATVFELILRLRSNLYGHVRNTCAEDFKEQQLRWNIRAIFGDVPGV